MKRINLVELCDNFRGSMLALCLLCSTIYAFAQGQNYLLQLLQSDFRVNDDSGNASQLAPAAAMANDGSFVITWYDERNDKSDIFAQRYEAAGTRIAANFQVTDISSSKSHYYPMEPNIAIDMNRNFIIAWDDFRSSADIYAQRYQNSGLPISSNFKAHDSLSLHGFASAVAMNGAGAFALAWVDNSASYFQRFDQEGQRLGEVIKMTNPDEYFNSPAILLDEDSNLITIGLGISYSNSSSIYSQRFNSSGLPHGSALKISSANTGAGGGYTYFNMTATATDAYGNYIVVWRDSRNGNADIYAQRFDSSGTALGDNFKVNDDLGVAAQSAPSTAMDLPGNCIIVWTDKRDGNSDIYGQFYDKDGKAIGSNYKVTRETNASNQSAPSVAMKDGKILTVWQDDRESSRGSDIWANITEYSISGVGQVEDLTVPGKIMLSQNYPNPFNPSTRINYWLSESSMTELAIFNSTGQRIVTLISTHQPAGFHTAFWNGCNEKGVQAPSGIYLAKLFSMNSVKVKKMIYIK